MNYYLSNCGHLDQDAKDVVNKKIKELLKTTKNNITVLIWLGIIDIRKLIDFIVDDEDLKAALWPIDQ
jgi:hypothetical protein